MAPYLRYTIQGLYKGYVGWLYEKISAFVDEIQKFNTQSSIYAEGGGYQHNSEPSM
jgi:hypothetical protein